MKVATVISFDSIGNNTYSSVGHDHGHDYHHYCSEQNLNLKVPNQSSNQAKQGLNQLI